MVQVANVPEYSVRRVLAAVALFYAAQIKPFYHVLNYRSYLNFILMYSFLVTIS